MSETRMYTRWVIEDRRSGTPVMLRGPMSEDICRDYVQRHPDRYRLMRVDVVEDWRETPVGSPPADPAADTGGWALPE